MEVPVKKNQSEFWDSLRVPDIVKQKINVIKKQSTFWKKLRVKLKRFIPVIFVVGVAIFLWNNGTALQLFMNLLRFVGQLLFAVFFMIVQFGALFWFMSRSKIERIRPEDPKLITFDDYWGQPRLKRLVRQWLGLLTVRNSYLWVVDISMDCYCMERLELVRPCLRKQWQVKQELHLFP